MGFDTSGTSHRIISVNCHPTKITKVKLVFIKYTVSHVNPEMKLTIVLCCVCYSDELRAHLKNKTKSIMQQQQLEQQQEAGSDSSSSSDSGSSSDSSDSSSSSDSTDSSGSSSGILPCI